MTFIGIIMLVCLTFALAVGIAVAADEWRNAHIMGSLSPPSEDEAAVSNVHGVLVDRHGNQPRGF